MFFCFLLFWPWCIYWSCLIRSLLDASASFPWGNDAFLPHISDSPYFRKNFLTRWKIFPILPFHKKSSSDKISFDLFLVIHYKFWMSLLFSLFWYIPLFRENYYFPQLLQIPLWFRNIYVFLHTLRVFRFPQFHYDAFMHHIMHVLDASDWTPLH